MKNGFRLLFICALVFFVNTFFAACVINAAPVAATTAAKTTIATTTANATTAHTTTAVTTKAAELTATTADAESALKKYDTGITYSNMELTPDKYLNQNVKFTGTVFQVIDGEDQVNIILTVRDGFELKNLFCQYPKRLISSRVLTDDYITIYGYFYGFYTYDSVASGPLTIPGVIVEIIDQDASPTAAATTAAVWLTTKR